MSRRLASIFVLLALVSVGYGFDVLENSDIARERMERIILATCIRANDTGGAPLAAPHLLYPEYIDDPLVFWHPGDPDPPPTTIDNSVPNAPNSAQISFTILDPNCWEGPVPPGGIQIRDNSAENNEGQFINLMVEWSMWTEPPFATPRPTRITKARSHLKALAIGMLAYSNDNQERLPNNMRNLWQGCCVSPRVMWNPGDSDPMPTAIVDNHPDGPESAQISFEYLGNGFRVWQTTPEDVLIRDNSPANNEGYGRLEVRGDYKVYFDPLGELGDADGNCHRDLADWSAGYQCVRNPNELIEQPVCYMFEWTRDHVVDLRDAATYFNQFTGGFDSIEGCGP